MAVPIFGREATVGAPRRPPAIRQFPGPQAFARTSGVAHTMIARLTTSAVEGTAVVGRHPSRGRYWVNPAA